MTQGVLAGLAGVSQSYISQVESGLKGVERRSTLIAIAAALHVTVADLLGQPGDPTDPLKAAAAAAVPAIRAAIIEVEEGERREPTRPVEEMAALVERVDQFRATSDYGTMAPLLPAFLLDAAAYGGITLVRAAYETSVCLRNLGYRDLALPAARIAVSGAPSAGFCVASAADAAEDPGHGRVAGHLRHLGGPGGDAASPARRRTGFPRGVAHHRRTGVQRAAAWSVGVHRRRDRRGSRRAHPHWLDREARRAT